MKLGLLLPILMRFYPEAPQLFALFQNVYTTLLTKTYRKMHLCTECCHHKAEHYVRCFRGSSDLEKGPCRRGSVARAFKFKSFSDHQEQKSHFCKCMRERTLTVYQEIPGVVVPDKNSLLRFC